MRVKSDAATEYGRRSNWSGAHRPTDNELRGRRVAALCPLLAKVLLCPLLMRLFTEALERPDSPSSGLAGGLVGGGEGDGASARAFAFLYGMLPSAPTVVVFAREYGERSSFLATLQVS